MASTSIWDMYEAVKAQLRKQFPDEPIVEDEVMDAYMVDGPDDHGGFRMRIEQVTVEQELRSRYKHMYAFVIYYSLSPSTLEGSSTVATATLYGVGEQLTNTLERLELPSHALHGRAMQLEVKDRRLEFRIVYSNYNWKATTDETAMEQLQQEGGKLKDG